MRTMRSKKAPRGITRGVKPAAKRRHGRKPAARNRTAEEVTRKLEILTPL